MQHQIMKLTRQVSIDIQIIVHKINFVSIYMYVIKQNHKYEMYMFWVLGNNKPRDNTNVQYLKCVKNQRNIWNVRIIQQRTCTFLK